mmetsp:Transcript_12048/g.28562  ORF Transcript_12048/g.28562 Transcript_12048/m.28562 type:complete len:173 (-) Transcript_12048:74-592(-)
MDNGWNSQYHQQQTKSNDDLQSLSMSSPVPVTQEQSLSSQIYPTSSANISSTMKRGRVCSEESSVSLHSITCEAAIQPGNHIGNCGGSPHVLNSINPKKPRSRKYQAPRSVKSSLLTALGTLAGGSSDKDGLHVNGSVPTRRRLSGGHLDKFIGEHDKSNETDPNRPRSMSF